MGNGRREGRRRLTGSDRRDADGRRVGDDRRPGRGRRRTRRGRLDFVFLTDQPDGPNDRPGLGTALDRLVFSLAPPGPSRVAFVPARGLGRPSTGAVVVSGYWTLSSPLSPVPRPIPRSRSPALASSREGPSRERLLERCLRRALAARRAGARVLGLGGPLAGDGWLAGRLAGETGLITLLGAPLGWAAGLDVSLSLLRWRGVDPERAGVVVLADPSDPAQAEAVIAYLGERVGRVGVWGLARMRRESLGERLRAESGAALAVYRTVEAGLKAADLLVLTGRAGAGIPGVADGENAGGELPVKADPGATGAPRTRPAVLVDLRAHPDGGAAGGRVPFARLLLALAGYAGPLCLGEVLFRTPPGWSGRPEPGLPAGYLSAPLAEAAVVASLARSPRLGVPHPRRQANAALMAWLRERAFLLGLRPVALALSPGPALPPER